MALLDEQLTNVIRIARQTLSFHKPARTDGVSTDFVVLAESALRVQERSIANKQIRVQTKMCEGVVVKAHPGKILQVVANLIVNAIDALPRNGTLAVKLWRCTKEAHLVVADKGRGIPNVYLHRIFEPFFTTKETGTGLGLSICKTIIERHDGKIRARYRFPRFYAPSSGCRRFGSVAAHPPVCRAS